MFFYVPRSSGFFTTDRLYRGLTRYGDDRVTSMTVDSPCPGGGRSEASTSHPTTPASVLGEGHRRGEGLYRCPVFVFLGLLPSMLG